MEGFFYVTITLFFFLCTGLFVGWAIWGTEAKLYKEMYEDYKKLYNSPEERDARFRKMVNDAFDRYMQKRNSKTQDKTFLETKKSE